MCIRDSILGSKDANEPLHCGLVGGSSYWFAYEAPEDGLLRVNTNGSEFDTILAAYRIENLGAGFDGLASVACDNNGGTDGIDSRVQFQVTKGTLYAIVIDGVGGAAGVVRLNYELSNTTLSSVTGKPLIRLDLRRSVDGMLTLSWPTDLGELHVQVRSELGDEAWRALLQTPIKNGERSEIHLQADQGSAFYRLHEAVPPPLVTAPVQ